MRILFVTRPHFPRLAGGQLTTHALALGLMSRGHRVKLLAEEYPAQEGEELVGPSPAELPYPMVESARASRDLPALVDAFRPEVVVVDGRHRRLNWSRAVLRAAGELPTLLHLHDAGSAALPSEPELRIGGTVAVSRFVAQLVRAHGAYADVVPPAIDPAHLVPPTRRRVALLVNPIAQKGVETALALARARPDVPFAFVRCWYPRRAAPAGLSRRLRGLPNVELRPSTSDPGELYGDARVLLVPSLGPEGFGRVAAEGRLCGVPVIASRTGGLPEAAGEGALLLDPHAGPDAWAAALASVWDHPREYRRRSRPEPRPELRPAVVAEGFEAALLSTVGRFAAAA